MYPVHCPVSNVDHVLGDRDVVSRHRTTDGTVSYLRCHCAALVLAEPGHGPRHLRAA